MKTLELPLHPKFELIFGYTGNAEKVVFYLDPEADRLCYVDGLQHGSANTWAYLLWAAHPSVRPHYHCGMLLLNRAERRLYVVNREEALEALRNPQPLGLPRPIREAQPNWSESQQLMADFLIWLGNLERKAA